MNCIEFRKKLFEEPRSKDPEFLAHGASCPDCSREYAEALAFEQKLSEALQVPPPNGLESRLISAQARHQEQSLRTNASLWPTTAALVLLALGSMFWIRTPDLPPVSNSGSLSRVVLDHIHTESEFLSADAHITERELRALFAEFDARATGSLGKVRHASRCRMRNQDGVHLVIAGVAGPITVLLMPGEHTLSVERVESARFSGLVVPTPYGSLALVGEKGEPLEPLLNRIEHKLIWGV